MLYSLKCVHSTFGLSSSSAAACRDIKPQCVPTSPGEKAGKLPFCTEGVHCAEMLTFTLLKVLREACNNT